MRSFWTLVLLSLCYFQPAHANGFSVTINTDNARAVLDAVRNPNLTREEALRIARQPAAQGLIRKQQSYGQKVDQNDYADALLAVAQLRDSKAEASFQFKPVRDNAALIIATLDALTDNEANFIGQVQLRVAQFTPPRLTGSVTGYVIVGGTSGVFAFGEPSFYLNLARFPSPKLASTVMAHELYHAVQSLVPRNRPPEAVKKCMRNITGGEMLNGLYVSLYLEGTGSYVGDMLALSKEDPAVAKERGRFERGVTMIDRSSTLLALSTHAFASGSSISFDDVYALGFYGDEILYSLGYVMAKAIAAEKGDAAVAELIDKPAAEFILQYADLKSYGNESEAPKLDIQTIDIAKKLAVCG